MGDVVGDSPGWTLVYKSGTSFNGGLNANEYQPETLLDWKTADAGAKFSDIDINSWLTGKRVTRVVGDGPSDQMYLFYTQRKDFCGQCS